MTSEQKPKITPASTGFGFIMIEDLKPRMPQLMLDCELMKIPIQRLDREKMTEILKTADETLSDVILNWDESSMRMTMSTATHKWKELCEEMTWSTESKEFMFVVGGKKGRISQSCLSASKASKILFEDVLDKTPILLDTIWFERFDKFNVKKRANTSWVDNPEQDTKKLELEDSERIESVLGDIPLNSQPATRAALEQLRLEYIDQLEEQKQEAKEEMEKMKEKYEQQIQKLQENQVIMANEMDDRETENQKVISEFKTNISTEKHDKVMMN